jgi:hypothetical protein
MGVKDAVENMGYRLEITDERERYSLYEDFPGQGPPTGGPFVPVALSKAVQRAASGVH